MRMGGFAMLDTAQMQFFAGVFFALVAVAFLWTAFFSDKVHQPLHYDIIHFICSFCAGAAGAFFTGAAILSADVPMGGSGKLVFQGTAGVALFALVFLIFRFKKSTALDAPGSARVAIGTATPFSQVALALADEAGASIDISAFTAQEKSAIPKPEELRCGTLQQARQSLVRLGELMPPGSVRPYKVELDETAKHFKLVVV